jgi:hypothetical protein
VCCREIGDAAGGREAAPVRVRLTGWLLPWPAGYWLAAATALGHFGSFHRSWAQRLNTH